MVVFIVFLSIGLVDFAVLMLVIILLGGSILAAYSQSRKNNKVIFLIDAR